MSADIGCTERKTYTFPPHGFLRSRYWRAMAPCVLLLVLTVACKHRRPPKTAGADESRDVVAHASPGRSDHAGASRIPELGNTHAEVVRICRLNGGYLEARPGGWFACSARTPNFAVQMSSGLVTSVALLRANGNFEEYRMFFERSFGARGELYRREDSEAGLRWTRDDRTVSLGRLDGGIAILIEHPAATATQSSTSRVISIRLDRDTAERAAGYKAYLNQHSWTQVGNEPVSVRGREGQVYTVPMSVVAEHCYLVLVVGGPGVSDADAAVYESNQEMTKDLDNDRDAVTQFCAMRSASLEVRFRSYRGSGPLFLLAYESSKSQHESPSWPSWSGPRPAMPRVISGKPTTPERLYKEYASTIYVVISGSSQGSAVAISDRHLLTNCHVIDDPNTIVIKRGNQIGVAHIARAESRSDRCILSTDDLALKPVHGIRPFSDLHIGEAVFAIGAPRGQEGSLSTGIISRFDRSGEVNVIQTTAAISPGSSGGPLFDSFGNLVGITSYKLRDSDGLNFALAADQWWR